MGIEATVRARLKRGTSGEPTTLCALCGERMAELLEQSGHVRCTGCSYVYREPQAETERASLHAQLNDAANHCLRIWLRGTAKAALGPLISLVAVGALQFVAETPTSARDLRLTATLGLGFLVSLAVLALGQLVVWQKQKRQRRTKLHELLTPRSRPCRNCFTDLPLAALGRTRCGACGTQNLVLRGMHALSRHHHDAARALEISGYLAIMIASRVWLR